MKYKIISFVLITLFIFGFFMYNYINTDGKISGIKDKVIRLHVVANSDSFEDQNIKLKVRDIVLKELGPKVKDLTEAGKANLVIKDNLNSIKETIQKELKKLNIESPIEVDLGRYEFPKKIYGDFIFPKGDYQALNIKIGMGGGKNWWCVMFPPLCFTEVTHDCVSDDAIEGLKKILTEEELKLLRKKDEKDKVVLKFKIVEVCKKLNDNMEGLLKRKL